MRKQLATLAFTAALAAAFTLFGCKEEKAKTPEAAADTVPQAEETAEQAETPKANRIAIKDINKDLIARYFEMDIKDFIKLLGDDYEIVQTGAEGLVTGYSYKEFGLMFSEEGWIEPINDSPKLFEIYGLTQKMNHNQIEKALGKGERLESVDFVPDEVTTYNLYINIPDSKGKYLYSLEFSSFSKEGTGSKFQCIRLPYYVEKEKNAANTRAGVYAEQPVKEFVAAFEKQYTVKKEFVEDAHDGDRTLYNVYENSELLFYVDLDYSDNAKVGRVIVLSPKIKTDRGIGVGSASKEIQAKYDFDGSTHDSYMANAKDFSGTFQLGGEPDDLKVSEIYLVEPSLMLTADLRIVAKP